MYGLQTTLEMAAAAARIAAASTMMAAAGTKLAPTLQRTQPRYQARDVLLMRMAAVYDAIDGESLWKDGEGKQIMRCMRW